MVIFAFLIGIWYLSNSFLLFLTNYAFVISIWLFLNWVTLCHWKCLMLRINHIFFSVFFCNQSSPFYSKMNSLLENNRILFKHLLIFLLSIKGQDFIASLKAFSSSAIPDTSFDRMRFILKFISFKLIHPICHSFKILHEYLIFKFRKHLKIRLLICECLYSIFNVYWNIKFQTLWNVAH